VQSMPDSPEPGSAGAGTETQEPAWYRSMARWPDEKDRDSIPPTAQQAEATGQETAVRAAPTRLSRTFIIVRRPPVAGGLVVGGEPFIGGSGLVGGGSGGLVGGGGVCPLVVSGLTGPSAVPLAFCASSRT